MTQAGAGSGLCRRKFGRVARFRISGIAIPARFGQLRDTPQTENNLGSVDVAVQILGSSGGDFNATVSLHLRKLTIVMLAAAHGHRGCMDWHGRMGTTRERAAPWPARHGPHGPTWARAVAMGRGRMNTGHARIGPPRQVSMYEARAGSQYDNMISY